MALFCAAIWRDFISLLRFPFLSHVIIVLMHPRYLEKWRVLFFLFLTHTAWLRYLWDVRTFALSWVFLFSGSICWSFLVHFKNNPEYLTRGTVQVLIPFMRFLLCILVFANGPADLGSIASYQRLLKWYLIPPCLTLSNIRYVSRVKWSNPGKGVALSPTPRCSSYWKRSLLVALDYGRQLYFCFE